MAAGAPQCRKLRLSVTPRAGPRSRQGSLALQPHVPRRSLVRPFGRVAPALSAGKPGWPQAAARCFRRGGRGSPRTPSPGHTRAALSFCPESVLAVVAALFPDVRPLSARAGARSEPTPPELALSRPLHALLCGASLPAGVGPLVLGAPSAALTARAGLPAFSCGLLGFPASSRVGGIWPLPVRFHLQGPLCAQPETRSHPFPRRRWPGALKSTLFLLTFLPGVPSGPVAGGSARALLGLCVDAAGSGGAVA